MNFDDEFDDEFDDLNHNQPLIQELLLNVPPLEQIKNGLSDSTGIVIVGEEHTLIPDLQRDLYCVPNKLIDYYKEFFLIGGGYAGAPDLPSASYLSTNIYVCKHPVFNTYDASNMSCITYEKADTGQKTFQMIYGMEYSMFGNFFVSEGKSGMVIKVRAKGRKTNYDILTLMQCCLSVYYPNINVGLGGVLHINGGRVIHFVTPETYPESFSESRDFFRWLKIHEVSCENLITVGAFLNDSNFLYIGQYGDNGPYIISSRYKFYNTVNFEAMGQFINDTTPNETEYIGYFNVAENLYSHN